MRCEHDTHTAELPGLPELPVKAPRTTQAQRIERMGYTGPKERRRCESCAHCEITYKNPDSISEFEVRRCQAGDFPVLRGGICNEWTAA